MATVAPRPCYNTFMKYGYLIRLILISALSYGSFFGTAQAHGLAVTHRIDSGNYIIEFEYQAAGLVAVGSSTIYSVRLLDNKTMAAVPFNTAAVTISGPSGTALQMTMTQTVGSDGLAQFIATLPQGGKYSAKVSISDDKKEIASGQTSFSVVADAAADKAIPVAGLRGWGIVMIAMFTGLLSGLLVPRRK